MSRGLGLFALCVLVGVSGCGRGAVTPPAQVCSRIEFNTLDMWATWGPGTDRITYKHAARTSADSTYIESLELSTGVAKDRLNVSAGVVEVASCRNCDAIAFAANLQIVVWGPNRPMTTFGRPSDGCHFPEWSPDGQHITYTRSIRDPWVADSLFGVRVVDIASGDDRALMRTATMPWFARGPVTWSPDGEELAMFVADSGRTRLVVVPTAGGEGRTVGWVSGFPSRASWLPMKNAFLFDASTPGCSPGEGVGSYRMDSGSGRVGPTEFPLGDGRVQWGHPFVISPEGTMSLHAGLGREGFGVIVVTEVATGRTTQITSK